MSFRALAAVEKAEGVPSAMVTCLLFVLAQHAGSDGTCFPSLKTIAKGMRCSEGGARNALRDAAEAGLIEVRERARRDGGQTSNTIVLLYYLPEEPLDVHLARAAARQAEAEAPPARRVGGAPASDEGAPLHQMAPPPAPDVGAFLNRSEEPGGAYAPTAHARPAEADPFDEFAKALPAKCRKVAADWTKARKLFPDVCARHGAERMIAAARAYTADPDVQRQTYLPPIQTLLANDGLFEFLPPAGTAVLPLEPAAEFDAPDEVIAPIVGALGVAGAKSWLHGAKVDAGRRLIVCAREFSAEKIRNAAGKDLRAIGWAVLGPDAAQSELDV